MKRAIILAFVFASTVAYADGTDGYWQQLVASKEAQSSTQIVGLAKQLDDAKRENADLRKQLETAKAARAKDVQPAKPGKE